MCAPKEPEMPECQSPCPPRLPRRPKKSLQPKKIIQKPRCDISELINKKKKKNPCKEEPKEQPCESACDEMKVNQCEDQNACESSDCPPPCPGECPPSAPKSTCQPPVSKKFLKMKYEIEQQNYIIEKLNREIEKKTEKNFPTTELTRLQNLMREERAKLMKMIRFAMEMQKELGTDKWGPISISAAYEKLSDCQREPLKCVRPPVTPSETSRISGFDELEILLLSDSNENSKLKRNLEEKEEMIDKLKQKLTEAEKENENCSKLPEKDDNCLTKSSAIGLFKQFDEVKGLNDALACNLQNIKKNVKQLRDELSTVK